MKRVHDVWYHISSCLTNTVLTTTKILLQKLTDHAYAPDLPRYHTCKSRFRAVQDISTHAFYIWVCVVVLPPWGAFEEYSYRLAPASAVSLLRWHNEDSENTKQTVRGKKATNILLTYPWEQRVTKIGKHFALFSILRLYLNSNRKQKPISLLNKYWYL